MIYKANEIKNWDTNIYCETKDKWIPARPENYRFVSIRQKLSMLWGVLIGKYDVLDWEN